MPIPTPAERELTAAVAEKNALLDRYFSIPRPLGTDARLWQTKFSISATRVRKAYITVYYG